MKLRLLEFSGRYDASRAHLVAALDEFAAQADVIPPTEVGEDGARRTLHDWAKRNDWHLWHPVRRGAAECAVLSRWPFDRRAAWRLTNLVLQSARTAPIYLTAARLKGGPWIGVWHSPAHTEGLRPGLWPTRVYLSALTGLRTGRMRMHGGGCALTGDFNLDLSRPAIRSQLAEPFPHMRWGWTRRQAPTEGGRVIDGVLTNLPIRVPSVTLPPMDGFDHRAVLTVLETRDDLHP